MKFKKVFISYNHKDKEVAYKVKEALQKRGIEVIIDMESMIAGAYIADFIENSIRETDVTISIVSQNSLLSAWVAMETINTFSYQKFNKGKQFISCITDTAFFERNFTDNALTQIDKEISEISSLIQNRLERRQAFNDLENELKRLRNLNNNFDEIIRKLRESLCIDISGKNFDTNFPKVIKALEAEPRKPNFMLFIVYFLISYIGIVGSIWGAAEAYSYFEGDKLRLLLGSYWYIIFYLLPSIPAFIIGRLKTKPSNKKYKTKTITRIFQIVTPLCIFLLLIVFICDGGDSCDLPNPVNGKSNAIYLIKQCADFIFEIDSHSAEIENENLIHLQKCLPELDFTYFSSAPKEDLEKCRSIMLEIVNEYISEDSHYSRKIPELKRILMYLIVDFDLNAPSSVSADVDNDIEALVAKGYQMFFKQVGRNRFQETDPFADLLVDYFYVYMAMYRPKERPIFAQTALLKMNSSSIENGEIRELFKELHISLRNLSYSITKQDDNLYTNYEHPNSILLQILARQSITNEQILNSGGKNIFEALKTVRDLVNP